MVDTGTVYDATLTPSLFQQWTNRSSVGATKDSGCPNFMFGGHLYTNLHVQVALDGNSLGLAFLACNLVTFDFPGKTLYLKKREPPDL